MCSHDKLSTLKKIDQTFMYIPCPSDLFPAHAKKMQ